MTAQKRDKLTHELHYIVCTQDRKYGEFMLGLFHKNPTRGVGWKIVLLHFPQF